MGILDRLQALGEGVLIAFDSIRSNKVRAALTILGIAVGVFVVTVMSAAVHGINAGVEESLAAAGPTTFYLTRWPAQINNCTGAADSCPWRHNDPLTVDEAHIIDRLPSVRAVSAHVGTSAPLKYRDRDLPGVQVDGYTPEWTMVDGGTIAEGRTFTSGENASAAAVVILNDKAAERLFDNASALGKMVSLEGRPFRVIGIYKATGNFFDSGNNSRAIVPFETARRRLNASTRWMDITVKPRDGVAQDVAIDDVIAALRTERGLAPSAENTFFVTTQERILDLYNSIVGVFFIVMLVLGSIGLMVGGVGVVAIMMISVTERTREIGVRKALGATRATILWQFLVEAATLTTIGAMAGLVIGGLLTWLVRALTSIDASIPALAIVAALAGSALSGVVFGLLPAIRASRLDPVDALRYE
ncbi:MAG TPA: ABC transporter permease [Gemmatimonadaceae bacterium]|nr:ABC transporter permease [Gemmatimonadaceae bacterium]